MQANVNIDQKPLRKTYQSNSSEKEKELKVKAFPFPSSGKMLSSGKAEESKFTSSSPPRNNISAFQTPCANAPSPQNKEDDQDMEFGHEAGSHGAFLSQKNQPIP